MKTLGEFKNFMYDNLNRNVVEFILLPYCFEMQSCHLCGCRSFGIPWQPCTSCGLKFNEDIDLCLSMFEKPERAGALQLDTFYKEVCQDIPGIRNNTDAYVFEGMLKKVCGGIRYFSYNNKNAYKFKLLVSKCENVNKKYTLVHDLIEEFLLGDQLMLLV